MITIVYRIDPSEKASELEWLKTLKIFPALSEGWDWGLGKPYLEVGMIVNSEAALSIKLRHKLNVQEVYKQRQF